MFFSKEFGLKGRIDALSDESEPLELKTKKCVKEEAYFADKSQLALYSLMIGKNGQFVSKAGRVIYSGNEENLDREVESSRGLVNWLLRARAETIAIEDNRFLPFPSKTGLVRVGKPGKDSSVFLTCNYHLTVQRVKRALRGMDAFLLITNSRGINVWCAAAGGHFTNHDVISVIKTSGIEKLVQHRIVTLPQLAAAGIEAKVIMEKTGWQVVWGPVYAEDIPLFLQSGMKKAQKMRQVKFLAGQRLEMGIAWAFPVSTIVALVLLFFWREGIIPAVILIWSLGLLIFLSFPLYEKLLGVQRERSGFLHLDFNLGGFQITVWGIILCFLVGYGLLFSHFDWNFFIRWGVLSLVVVILLSFELKGTSPFYKSPYNEESFFRVAFDLKKCQGAGVCEDVCPRSCFRLSEESQKAAMPGALRCVGCGACIIQCPHDVLWLRNSLGEEILPGTVRRRKINLFGRRIKDSSSS